MKKPIFTIIFLLFLLTTISFAEVKYSTSEELKKIADDVQTCIDKNYINDYTMAQCVISGTEKYNIEIKKSVKLAEKYLSQTDYKEFLKKQTKWEKFIKKHDKTYKIKYPPYEPYLLVVNDMYEYTKDRAIYLDIYIKRLLIKRSLK